MSANNIKALFFDFGGVFTYSPISAIAEYAQQVNADPMVLGALVFGDYGKDTDHSWHKLERGEISFEQAANEIAAAAKQAGFEIDLIEAFSTMGVESQDLVRSDMVDKSKKLKAEGYQMAMITNNIREYSAMWRKLFEVEDIFEHIIDSSQEGMRKPNPDIYHLAMERVGVKPENSLFLDDLEVNVNAAMQVGMQSILVTDDSDATFKTLDTMLKAS